MPSSPRVPPLRPQGNPSTIQALLARTGVGQGASARNLYLTLAKHPGLLRRYLGFAGTLLNAGGLPPRCRELVILRTSYLRSCDYEWAHHARIGREHGVVQSELDALRAGLRRGDWNALELALLLATDELVVSGDVQDSTWSALADQLDEVDLIEFVMLVGNYVMAAGLLNTLRVSIEPELQGEAMR